MLVYQELRHRRSLIDRLRNQAGDASGHRVRKLYRRISIGNRRSWRVVGLLCLDCGSSAVEIT